MSGCRESGRRDDRGDRNSMNRDLRWRPWNSDRLDDAATLHFSVRNNGFGRPGHWDGFTEIEAVGTIQRELNIDGSSALMILTAETLSALPLPR